MDLLRRGQRPRDILTRASFENAIAGVAATGGSTNAVLHLLALAREAGLPLDLPDFDRVSRRTPIVADLMPGGTWAAPDLYAAGGTLLVARRLIDGGRLDGSPRTADGRTWAEHAAEASEAPGQKVVATVDRAFKKTGGLVILRGNLCPDGAVVKMAGHERSSHRGPARVFDREEDAFAAVKPGRIRAGDVVAIRYEGPRARGAGRLRPVGSNRGNRTG